MKCPFNQLLQTHERVWACMNHPAPFEHEPRCSRISHVMCSCHPSPGEDPRETDACGRNRQSLPSATKGIPVEREYGSIRRTEFRNLKANECGRFKSSRATGRKCSGPCISSSFPYILPHELVPFHLSLSYSILESSQQGAISLRGGHCPTYFPREILFIAGMHKMDIFWSTFRYRAILGLRYFSSLYWGWPLLRLATSFLPSLVPFNCQKVEKIC